MSDFNWDLVEEVAAHGPGHPQFPATYEELREWMDNFSDLTGDYQGTPVPLPDFDLVLNDTHPMRDYYDIKSVSRSLREGNAEELIDEVKFACHIDDGQECEIFVNDWVCHVRNVHVFVVHRGGKAYALKIPLSPDQSMRRLTLLVRTIGTIDAWSLEAEYKAREKLQSMLVEHQWRQYELTGSFLERSKRSDILYVFRRLRPTVALTSRARFGGEAEYIRCLAVLCLHSIGYYQDSWGGCLTPTDDVIAHLLLMRGDEANFWAKSNLHEPWEPQAGL
jgi:hypothetical protein